MIEGGKGLQILYCEMNKKSVLFSFGLSGDSLGKVAFVLCLQTSELS